ncbi:hypothetical protein A1O1_06454 [Capronia coronata CBS 617.96]|uniref:Condensation domain-containing protein n=1 Tax=Capronia coronata CBS 617.96 TaxID=1182541 RepID=W9Y8X1_9EURO|nr:uncharacterized protein A1O1_06454 [Capronia coronata CBS 617.96]EXJ86085.1 hypothetical protein A1O1_06454 [Capronia coronata CBS 617.96]
MSVLSGQSFSLASPERAAPSESSLADGTDGILQDEDSRSGAIAAVTAVTASRAGPQPGPCHSPGSQHTIHLSSIEHCMPRSYIRICLAYRLPDTILLPDIVERLNRFVRKAVDAKPYLSGFVVGAKDPGSQIGAVEIQFSDDDFLHYPRVGVRHLTREEVPYTYDELDQMGLPPSVIRPDLVSALGESADEERAPVFWVQANVLEGGLIVSVYLHHCISDGTGIGLLISGTVLNDDFTFQRHLDTRGHDTPTLSMRLEAFAHHKSVVRQQLSYSLANQINDRELKWKRLEAAPQGDSRTKPRGRGCIIAFSLSKLANLKMQVERHAEGHFMTLNDVLQALIWRSMTKARVPSLSQEPSVKSSKLIIPINIRNKLKSPLSGSYFGAAIDFASVQMPLSSLTDSSISSMAHTAKAIRKGINAVDEPYIRQAIALARHPDPQIDVRDLQASNMERIRGADMYITSWEKLKCYDATFEMGLGPPDWVRKPWSKDPGSCIVLPYDQRKDYLEVVIQMTEADMARLLEDDELMDHVVRVID